MLVTNHVTQTRTWGAGRACHCHLHCSGPSPRPSLLGPGSQCLPLLVLPRDSQGHFLEATSQLLEASSPRRWLWLCSLQMSLLPRPHCGSLSHDLSHFPSGSFHPTSVYTAGWGQHFTTSRSHGLRPRSFYLTPRRPLHSPPCPFRLLPGPPAPSSASQTPSLCARLTHLPPPACGNCYPLPLSSYSRALMLKKQTNA